MDAHGSVHEEPQDKYSLWYDPEAKEEAVEEQVHYPDDDEDDYEAKLKAWDRFFPSAFGRDDG